MRIVNWTLRSLGALSLAACAVGLLAVLPGCETDPGISTTTSDYSNSADFDCSDKLNAAMEMLRPERLSVTTDAETAESRLNTWLDDCGQDGDAAEPVGPEVEKLLKRVLSSTQMNRLASAYFVDGDAEHLRNCQIHKALANIEFDKAESEVENIAELFHFCVRNIALHTSADDRLPLTPYEILLFGRGTPEDVAWVYIDLLRQLQIDAVILRPHSTANADANANANANANADANANDDDPQDKDDNWLIGVLWEKQVYLFDPRLGTPIPGQKDTGKSPTVLQAATLSEVIADDGLLRKLDAATMGKYPFTSDKLRRVTVEVVGTRSLWTSPMQRLQAALSGDRSVVVYDGLQDDADVPGLLTRVAEAGGESWTTGDISIWPYPQQQIEAAGQRDEAGRKRFSELESPLDAPIPITVDRVAGTLLTGKPERRHFRTRITHLLGDFDTAIRNYQTLRIRLVTSARQPLPAEIQTIHQGAADDAAYWIGLCQFDRGKFPAAVSTFRDYLRRYEKSADAAWTAHARLMLANSLAEAEPDDLSEALFELTLEEIPEQLAGRQRFWNERWEATKAAAE